MSTNRRRMMAEYVRDDATEELDYFTVITWGDESYGPSVIYAYGYYVELSDGSWFESDMWYSIDEGPWVKAGYDAGIEVLRGQRVRFKSEGYEVWRKLGEYSDYVEYAYQAAVLPAPSGDWWHVEGTPLSLLHGDRFRERKNDLLDGCFFQMFRGNTAIAQINNPKTFLPSTELAPWCYQDMFSDTYIENAPELPAENLAEGCYCGMFGGCVDLEDAPRLDAGTLVGYCYHSMFSGCSSLCYLKVSAVDGYGSEGAVSSMLDGIKNSGVAVLSQELMDTGFAEAFLPSYWTVIGEDYPVDGEGYPETDAVDGEVRFILVNTVFVSVDEEYLSYRRREAGPLGKAVYDMLWRKEDVGAGYSWVRSGFYVDRKEVDYTFTGEDYIYMEAPYRYGDMEIMLYSDGMFECWIYDY